MGETEASVVAVELVVAGDVHGDPSKAVISDFDEEVSLIVPGVFACRCSRSLSSMSMLMMFVLWFVEPPSVCLPKKTDLELRGKQFKSGCPDLNFCLSQVITPKPDLEKT